jgi:hypothetical protein
MSEKSWRERMAVNGRVVKEQWADYMVEIEEVIIPGIRAATWREKGHKTWAFFEEFPDKMPRLTSYLFPLLVAGWVLFAIEVMQTEEPVLPSSAPSVSAGGHASCD